MAVSVCFDVIGKVCQNQNLHQIDGSRPRECVVVVVYRVANSVAVVQQERSELIPHCTRRALGQQRSCVRLVLKSEKFAHHATNTNVVSGCRCPATVWYDKVNYHHYDCSRLGVATRERNYSQYSCSSNPLQTRAMDKVFFWATTVQYGSLLETTNQKAHTSPLL
jgi:hypothetical protein